MKNKKLFAILTLVCFMFTLMPVAAFAAPADYAVYVTVGSEPKTDDAYVAPTTTFSVLAYNGATPLEKGAYYAVNEAGDVVQIQYSESSAAADFSPLQAPGVYTIYGVVDATGNSDLKNLVNNANKLDSEETAASAVVKIKNNAVLAGQIINTVAYVTVEATYVQAQVDVYEEVSGAWVDTDNVVSVTADNGFSGNVKVQVKLTQGKPVVGKAPEITAPDYVTVTPVKKAVTDAAGKITYTISANRAGTFNVVFSYGDAEDVVLKVVATDDNIVNVEVVKESANLINNIKTGGNIKTGATVKFTDVNGAAIDVADSLNPLEFNATTGLNNANGVIAAANIIKATVVSQPANSKLTAADFKLVPNAVVVGDFDLVAKPANLKVGTYEVKFALANGKAVTVAFEAAKYTKTAGIRFVQPVEKTVALGQPVPTFTVEAYDVNGVVKDLTPGTEYTVNYQGNALVDVSGTLKVDTDEKYIGSTITVLAKDANDKFVATTTVEVVDNGLEIVYADKTAEVGVTTVLKANVVDVKGNKVVFDDADDTINVVVLEKPEKAYVYAQGAEVGSGKYINVTFFASVAGEYKIQTVAIDATGQYVTGIETITVGGNEAAFNDVVVVSIGATKMIVNDEVVELDVAPYIENSRTMMQYNVLGAFGFDIQWVQETRSVVAEGNGIKVVMTIGSKVATVNGEEVTLDVAPQIVNGRTVVPVGFLTGTFGINNQIIKAADGSVADILFTK